jgi:hypothetical protein
MHETNDGENFLLDEIVECKPMLCGLVLKKGFGSFYFIGSFLNVYLSPILPIVKPYCFNFNTFFSNSINFEFGSKIKFIFMDTLHTPYV